MRWHDNPNTRIEDVLGGIEEIVRAEANFSLRSKLLHEIMCELIHVEMELRSNLSREFKKADYESRFPDHETAVESAWQRLKALYPNRSLFTTAVVRTKSHRELELDEPHAVIPKVFGPFQQIEQIGEGGFGVVCKGFDVRSSEWVALKFPRRDVIANDDLLSAFQAEARRVIGLRHPGIVETKSIEFHDGYVAIVQQLISGSNLKEATESLRDHHAIATLIARLADALAFANSNGLIHRDLKPANILLDSDGLPYISDFGLSLHETDQALYPDEQCGTPPYMSPQLVEGLTRNLDGRTDIWSLGVILYELLAGRRPFLGISRADVFEQIETRDPRPIREIDSTVHRELQRICMRCLEKSARDRYMTADELADDLRHWLSGDLDEPPAVPAIVPRGLRSYGSNDASFFSSLLPGPRDRHGVPLSVQFWVEFLQAKSLEAEELPIGVLCGPSGSGKSSFVKAAVLPKVSGQLDVLYVESTRADTEVRLLKALRESLVDVPQEISLTDLFRGIAAGRWNPEDKRIVVVLDQFEQRLGINDRFDQSQIAKAMRHCNRENLICLLVVRDGFWLALSRFFDALEIDVLENKNFRSIDLFDKPHAEKVLRQLGHAYGKLPAEPVPLTKAQANFIESTVSQLAKGHFVTCIQLVVFAEMFKLRKWEQHELKSIGGVTGVGEAFLDYHFGEESQFVRYRSHREHVQNVLEALLPDQADSRIRGALKSEAELKKSAGLIHDQSGFAELLQILERDLRLISRADPDRGSVDVDDLESNANLASASFYQLTHDYLVPSVRSWLEQIKHKSPRARARSRFSKLAKSWDATRDDRFLPTPLEFASTLRFVRQFELQPDEQRLFRKTSRFYLRRVAAVIGVLLVCLGSLFLFSRGKNRELASSIVSSFLSDRPDAVAANVKLMRQQSSHCVAILNELARAGGVDAESKTRICIGLAMLDEDLSPDELSLLVQQVSEENDPEGMNFLNAFRKHRTTALPELLKEFRALGSVGEENPGLRKSTRFKLARLAAVIVGLGAAAEIENFVAAQEFGFHLEFARCFSMWHDSRSISQKVVAEVDEDRAFGAICLAFGNCTPEHGAQSRTLLTDSLKNHLRIQSNTCSDPWARACARWACGDSRTIRSICEPTAINQAMVEISTDGISFSILEREVTVGEFMEYINDPKRPASEPATPINYPAGQENLPAYNLSKIDAILFCNWLSMKHGLVPCYERIDEKFQLEGTPEMQKLMLEEFVENRINRWRLVSNASGYRLPTHEQWGLAACTSAMSALDQPDIYFPMLARCNSGKLQPVGQLMPNENGLFDVFGNVAEACWGDEGESLLPAKDGSRGGSYESKLENLLLSGERFEYPYSRVSIRGFRIVKMDTDHR